MSVGGRLRRFITSLLCPRTHPAQELAELYHQRWEIELGFREIKQTLRRVSRCCAASNTLVRQELCGAMLIAYTLLPAGCADSSARPSRAPARKLHTASYAIVNCWRCNLDSEAPCPSSWQPCWRNPRRHFVRSHAALGTQRSSKRASKFPNEKCQSALNRLVLGPAAFLWRLLVS